MTPRTLSLLLVGILLAGCQATAVEPAAPASQKPAIPVLTDGAVLVSPTPVAAKTVTTPSVAASALPTASATLPPATAFAFDLYEEGDFVAQYTFEWCVGASIQMAHNLVGPEVRNSHADQQALWEMARARSTNSYNGANPRGWAQTLIDTGLGPYDLVSVPDFDEALRTAAAAIRETDRPVGLVMWRGRHAWVMSGFESVGDPAVHPAFAVTGIRVLDPLYPHGSGTWGPSPAPNALLSPAELATQFVVREPRRWSSDLPAGHLLVLPVTEQDG